MKLSINEFKIGDEIILNDSKILIKDLKDGLYKIDFNGIILTKNKDELFNILMIEERKLFTHNCQQRVVCGQLGSIASRMALDDNQATTIDGTHKGSGMTKAQGIVSNIQFYFEDMPWIENWFGMRGLNARGYEPGEDPDETVDPSTINLGEDEDISIDENRTQIDFNGIHKEIDNTKAQKFEEV